MTNDKWDIQPCARGGIVVLYEGEISTNGNTLSVLKERDDYRQAIEDAPHADDCHWAIWMRKSSGAYPKDLHCSCWKIKALKTFTG